MQRETAEFSGESQNSAGNRRMQRGIAEFSGESQNAA